jgi:hypothetical protein
MRCHSPTSKISHPDFMSLNRQYKYWNLTKRSVTLWKIKENTNRTMMKNINQYINRIWLEVELRLHPSIKARQLRIFNNRSICFRVLLVLTYTELKEIFQIIVTFKWNFRKYLRLTWITLKFYFYGCNKCWWMLKIQQDK